MSCTSSRWVAWAAALLLPLLLAPAPADASTVIYHSAPDNSYGWCAGYGYERAHSCAKRYCVDAGGTDCEMAVECSGGWGAIAFAQDPASGFGASCGFGDAYSARTAALSACIAQSNTLCWTETTFSRNASTMSDDSNRDFDRTWYAQAVLQVRHFDLDNADGQMGPRTRAALGEFQTRIGRPAGGALDDELFQRLLDAVDGAQSLAHIIKRDIYDEKVDEIADYSYGQSSSPAPERSFSAELMERSVGERRLALATRLASGSTKCSLPAIDVELMADPDAGIWSIQCAEGSYTLMMSEGSTVVVNNGGGDTDQTKAEPEAKPEPEPNPEPKANPPPLPGHRRH